MKRWGCKDHEQSQRLPLPLNIERELMRVRQGRTEWLMASTHQVSPHRVAYGTQWYSFNFPHSSKFTCRDSCALSLYSYVLSCTDFPVCGLLGSAMGVPVRSATIQLQSISTRRRIRFAHVPPLCSGIRNPGTTKASKVERGARIDSRSSSPAPSNSLPVYAQVLSLDMSCWAGNAPKPASGIRPRP